LPNLFINTRHEYAEEDRLTNAFMAVLEHADRVVLAEFLSLVCGSSIGLDEVAEVSFDLQVAFKASRPDARIRTSDITVVIETKRGADLDEDQFRRHWTHLRDSSSRTVLLALTGSNRRPPQVDQLAKRNEVPSLTVAHVGWPRVLELVCRLKADFPAVTATGLLLSQFEEYLRHLGYYFYEGEIVDALIEYGTAMKRVVEHERSTVNQLIALLRGLADAVQSTPEIMPLEWEIKSFSGRDKVESDRVNVHYLTADVPGLENARYRVLPFLAGTDLGLKFYFTCSPASDFEPMIHWWAEHRQEIESDCGPFLLFGHLDRSIFHISRELPQEDVQLLFAGAPETITRVGESIGAHFIKVHEWIGRARRG